VSNQQEVFVKMALNAWDIYIKRADKLFNSLTDQELLLEVSHGKNRGIYLLGHLTAVNDGMISIFGLGDRLYKQLDAAFIDKPDKSGLDMPAIAELRSYWTNLNNVLDNYFSEMKPAEWFQRHNLMTDEDLIKEPHRNKLSVLMNRTNHLAWHYGQLLLIK
jgi:hypothetical protein